MNKKTFFALLIIVEISILSFLVMEGYSTVYIPLLVVVFSIIAGYLYFKQNPELDEFAIYKPKSNQEEKECQVCGTFNHINRTYCKKCNTRIKNIVCPVCNTTNPYDQKYCTNCDSILQNTTRH